MLASGARLGPYEVLSPLGAGGMGEVYRARDTKLGRDVALKVLPEAFTADRDRLARFEREAKLLASLNHPHIAQIYGLEEADGQKALVLELVEGPTLADRLAQGAIPLDEALPVARQIAEALEAAHEQGIVHRDLKPANVKVKSDGTVKVLDFGLARAFEPEGSDPNASQSPTLTARATQMGVILGTAAYMSPEQARGKPVDKRADIWAFGVVLYEMLTGRRPFIGEDVSLTLAEVMKSEPDWSRLPDEVPQPIRRLLRRCLEKSPQRRLHDIADARLEIEDLRAGGTSAESGAGSHLADMASPRIRTARPAVGSLLLWAAGAAFAGAALGFVLGRGGDRGTGRTATPRRPQVPTRTVVDLPDSVLLTLGGTQVPLLGFDSPAVAVSPDGRHLVYVGQAEEGTRLFHRDLSRFDDPRPVPGTEGAVHAFFSPDSRELGFLTSDRVRKVTLDGGTVTTLCRARSAVQASWIGSTIYFTDIEGSILNGVDAEGGEPSTLLDVPDRVGSWAVPSSVLPDGRSALVSVWPADSTRSDYAEIRVLSFDGRGDKALGITGYGARYLPSGHLVFARGGSLMAAPFDLEHLELRGEPVPVLTGVALDSIFAQVHAAFADNGTVAYVPGRALAVGRLAWVDREGREGRLGSEEGTFQSLDPSPDDQRMAVQVADVRDYVWIFDARTGGRDLAGPGMVGWPVWSPEGTALALTTRPAGGRGFEIVRHDLGTGTAETLLSSERSIRPESWAQAGYIGFSEWGHPPPRAGRLKVDPPGEPQWVSGDGGEGSRFSWGAALSPDGAWIAYTSQEETGRYQVWLEKMGGGARRQVSTDGGLEPVWCRTCGELFFRQGYRVFASRTSLEPHLEIGPARAVFEAPGFVDTWGISYRVSSDGQRMYYVRRSQPPVRDRIHVIQNWFSELERLAPRTR